MAAESTRASSIHRGQSAIAEQLMQSKVTLRHIDDL